MARDCFSTSNLALNPILAEEETSSGKIFEYYVVAFVAHLHSSTPYPNHYLVIIPPLGSILESTASMVAKDQQTQP